MPAGVNKPLVALCFRVDKRVGLGPALRFPPGEAPKIADSMFSSEGNEKGECFALLQ